MGSSTGSLVGALISSQKVASESGYITFYQSLSQIFSINCNLCSSPKSHPSSERDLLTELRKVNFCMKFLFDVKVPILQKSTFHRLLAIL